MPKLHANEGLAGQGAAILIVYSFHGPIVYCTFHSGLKLNCTESELQMVRKMGFLFQTGWPTFELRSSGIDLFISTKRTFAHYSQ